MKQQSIFLNLPSRLKKKGDIAVTQIGATNAKVKALGNEISDIAKKNKYVENTKINPLIN